MTMLRDAREVCLPVMLEPDEHGKHRFTTITVPIETYDYVVPVSVTTWTWYRHRTELDSVAMAREAFERDGITITRDPWLAYVEALVAPHRFADPGAEPRWWPAQAVPPALIIRYRLHINTRGYKTPEGTTR